MTDPFTNNDPLLSGARVPRVATINPASERQIIGERETSAQSANGTDSAPNHGLAWILSPNKTMRLLALLILPLAGCGHSDNVDQRADVIHGEDVTTETIASLSSRLQRIVSLLAEDSARGDKTFELKEQASIEGGEQLRQFYLNAIAEWEPKLHELRDCSPEERRNAIQRNRLREFSYDPEIEDSDLQAVLDFIEEHE